jgi:hypothetical protein
MGNFGVGTGSSDVLESQQDECLNQNSRDNSRCFVLPAALWSLVLSSLFPQILH